MSRYTFRGRRLAARIRSSRGEEPLACVGAARPTCSSSATSSLLVADDEAGAVTGTLQGIDPRRACEPGSPARVVCALGWERAARGMGPPQATEPGSGAEPRV